MFREIQQDTVKHFGSTVYSLLSWSQKDRPSMLATKPTTIKVITSLLRLVSCASILHFLIKYAER